jgi:hypothetical protein
MAINFPNSPTNGQTFTDPNGSKWVYETATNSWTAEGTSSQIVDATETDKGIVQLATTAEVTTGTNTTKVITPAGLKVELNKKVNLAGGTMTGNLTLPNLIATASVQGALQHLPSITLSGVSTDLTGIPTWAKRLTLVFNNIKTSGASSLLIVLGTPSGVDGSHYFSYATAVVPPTTLAVAQTSNGISIGSPGGAASALVALLTITRFDGFAWAYTGSSSNTSSSNGVFITGLKGMSESLTRVRITTVSGADTFTAGSVSLIYEG